MSELKPCCCGSTLLEYSTYKDESDYEWHRIECHDCYRQLDEHSKERLFNKWNSRPIEDAQSAENEQLKARVIELSNALLVEKADNTRMREAIKSAKPFLERAAFLTDGEELQYICEGMDILNKALNGGE